MDPAGATVRSADQHVVHVYDKSGTLVRGVAAYLAVALLHGEAALVVASAAHRDALDVALDQRGPAVDELRARGQYVALDAEALLKHLVPDGRLDPHAFGALIGTEVEDLAGRGGGLSVYGELVALLWRRGQAAAAVQVEDLWNDLAGSHRFRLYCGYDSAAFDREGTPAQAARVLTAHSDVRCS
ncbi:MAG: MEDS domain-containing protein [Frankiaceae bacterium]|nr:MEDS domain-containing protein [Frankiaceae bacterium]